MDKYSRFQPHNNRKGKRRRRAHERRIERLDNRALINAIKLGDSVIAPKSVWLINHQTVTASIRNDSLVGMRAAKYMTHWRVEVRHA